MEMSSLLVLDANDRAIGDFLVGLPVQRHPDRPVQTVSEETRRRSDRSIDAERRCRIYADV
jgi:hypothetical protein